MALSTTPNFPTSLDSFVNPGQTTKKNATGYEHHLLHQLVGNAVELLEAKVGVTDSAVTTSLDYLVTNSSAMSPGHMHAEADLDIYDTPGNAEVLSWNATQGKMEWIAGASGLYVSSNDTTSGFLNGKLLAGEGLDLTEGSDGGDETLTVSGEDATTSNKGIASFVTADFGVSSGAVSLKDTVVKTVASDSGSATPSTHGFTIAGGEGIDTTGATATITIAGENATTSNKGIASFSSSHFSVTSGVVSLVASGVDDTHIDWGTGAAQVSAVDLPIADSGSHYTGTEVETALQEIGAAADAHSMNGFESRSDSTLAWVNATRTLTLASSGTTYYWIEGLRYSFATGSDETIIISDATGLHLIYIDSTPALQEIVNPSEAQTDDAIQNKCLVAMIYYNTTVSYDTGYVVADERHNTVMSPETHHWIHDNMGAKYKEGFAISAYTLDTATDAAVSYDLSDGEFYDEDLEHDIDDGSAATQYEQVLQGDAELPVLMKLADGSWVEQAASTLPYVVDGSKDLQYMDTDNSWTQTTLGNNKFMLMWVVATNDWQYPIKAIQGSQEYNNHQDALDGSGTEIIDWSTLPSAEFVVLYQLIMKQASGTNVNGKIIEVIDFRFSDITGSSATTQSHGSLSDLSNDDHAQYMLVDGTRGVSSATPTLIFKDTSCTDTDINATVLVAATTTTTNAEDIDVSLQQQVDGSLTTFLTSDADGSLTIGQASQAVAFNSSAVTGISSLTATTITDGTASLNSGAWTGIASAAITTTGQLTFRDAAVAIASDNDGDLDLDADVSIDFQIGTTEQITLTDGAITPTTDNDIDLGSAGNEFKDLFIDGTATVDALVADTADINGGTLSTITIDGNWTAAGQTCADLGTVSAATSITSTTITDGVASLNSGAWSAITTLATTDNISIGGSNKELRFYEGVNYVGFEAPALGGNQIWILPTADSTGVQYLQSDGGGNLSWTTPAGAGDVSKVGTPVDNQVGVWTGDGTLEGDTGLTWSGTQLNIETGNTLDVVDVGGFEIGGTAVASTAAELNITDGGDTTEKVLSTQSKARAYLASAQDVGTGAATKLLISTESYDVGNDFASNKFVTAVAGYHLILGLARLGEVIGDGKYIETRLYVDGAEIVRSRAYSPSASGVPISIASDVSYVASSKDIELYCQHDHGANREMAATTTFMAVNLLSV